jgi:hypothetical protein
MVHIRFTSFVLGLLFVMHALRVSSAYAHHGGDQEGVVVKGKEVAVQKVCFVIYLNKSGLASYFMIVNIYMYIYNRHFSLVGGRR